MRHHDIVRHVLALAEGDGNGGGSGGSGDAQNGGQSGGNTGTGGQGGSGDGGDRGGAGGGTGTGSGNQGSGSGATGSGSQNGNAGNGSGGQGDDPARRIDSLPQWAQQHIREIRGEAAENRTKRTAAESQMTDLQRKVAEAFGIDTGDGKPDPDKLAADLTAAQQTARDRAIELAVYRGAGDRADPSTLLDSRTFMDSVADLDPNASDFPTRLGDKIATWSQNNPRLAAGGSTTGGRPGGGIGQGGRGPQSGPTGVAAGRALHPAYKAQHNAASTT